MEETLKKIQAVVNTIVSMIRQAAPKDTGNLAYNSVRQQRDGEGRWEIYVDMNIAPYMPYTNEPWIAPKWNGKKNPNEAWWDNVCESAIKYAERALGGKVTITKRSNS